MILARYFRLEYRSVQGGKILVSVSTFKIGPDPASIIDGSGLNWPLIGR